MKTFLTLALFAALSTPTYAQGPPPPLQPILYYWYPLPGGSFLVVPAPTNATPAAPRQGAYQPYYYPQSQGWDYYPAQYSYAPLYYSGDNGTCAGGSCGSGRGVFRGRGRR